MRLSNYSPRQPLNLSSQGDRKDKDPHVNVCVTPVKPTRAAVSKQHSLTHTAATPVKTGPVVLASDLPTKGG